MLADLDQIRSMLEAMLSFLCNDQRPESMTLTDIASSLQLVADQFADMGHKVSYVGPDHLTALARPGDLHRCLTNLVENAVRFGNKAVIHLTPSGEAAVIEIEDDGPGISAERKEMMLQPFVRGDSAQHGWRRGLWPRTFDRERDRVGPRGRAFAARSKAEGAAGADIVAASGAEPALDGVT